MNPIEYYTYMYPQLTLGIKKGMKETEEYQDIVLRGQFKDELKFPFEIKGEEERISLKTPIGITEVLYLPEREIFEYFVKVLAYKNEDEPIPKTTGAILIDGLNSWRKIYAHQEEFLKDHNEDEWDAEFDKFTSVRANYKDTVLLISKGYYSAVSYQLTKYDEATWLDLSKKIRIYHENAHLISRKLFPEHKEAIRDEVIADSVGIVGALGYFDVELEKLVLGLKEKEYTKGYRLENYVEADKLDEAVSYARTLIDKLDDFYKDNKGEAFDLLLKIEEEYIR